MIRILVFLTILFLSVTNTFAQKITICDENNLQPIENVMIFGEKQKNFVLSDIKGNADLSTLSGRKVLFFRHPSYEFKEFDFLKAINDKTIYLKESNIKISEVVIAANKWAQSRTEIPSKISSISAKQVDLLTPQTTADLLATGGEVFIQKSQQGGGSPMIRGFSTNRLLIAIDGVRMNTAIFRSGNLQNVISLDAFAIESTEIFFGPGSVIYGSDAIGGVMSFSTLSPTFSDSSEILIKGKSNARYSSANNELSGHFDINIGYNKWAYLTSFTYTKYGDLKMGSVGTNDYLREFYVLRENNTDVVKENSNSKMQNPSGYNQTNFMQKIGFKPNKRWNLTYGFHYSTTSNYDRYDRLIRTKNDLPRSAEWYYGPQTWMMNNLTVVNKTSSNLYNELTIRVAHQFFEESRHDRNFNALEKNHNVEKVNAVSVNFDFHKEISPKHQLFYGIESIYNGVNSIGEIEDISTGQISKGLARYPESNWQSYAAYATYNFEYSKKLRLNAGARYNQFLINAVFDTAHQFPFDKTKLSNGALTGSIGLVYNPIKNLWISSNLSTGFRSPNIDDMGKIFDSGEGIVVVPNTELGSEYAYNAEFDITHIIADVFKYNITAYYTLLDNALIRRDFQFNGQDSMLYKGEMCKVKAVQNGTQTKVQGVQAGIDIKFPAGFGFDTRFNYQKGTEEAENGTTGPSRHAAPMFGVIHLVYSKPKIKLDLYSIYTAEVSYSNLSVEERDKAYLYAKDTEGNPFSPSWYTINFKAMYQISRQFSVTAGVENITDIRYRPYSSGLTAAGRNYILALKALF
ncbi:MAG: TonB-dependent receptor [Salinivirgaceae bacterium]|jgi:hemoglobin/transferrin/lactoferrin receptor protein|nr:TonB-dependent receptor [Salinivirgaceae bacterium]